MRVLNPTVLACLAMIILFFFPWAGVDFEEMVATEDPAAAEELEVPGFWISGFDIGTFTLYGQSMIDGYLDEIAEEMTEEEREAFDANRGMVQIPSELNILLVLLISPICALLAVLFAVIGGPVRTFAFLSGLSFTLIGLLILLGGGEAVTALVTIWFWISFILGIALLIMPFIFGPRKVSQPA